MGSASATLRRSTSAVGPHSLDLRKVIDSDPELKAKVDTFRNATLPRVKEDLAALARFFPKASSCVAAIRAALVSYHREKMGRKRRRQHRRKATKYADTIADLDKFKLAVDSFPGLNLDGHLLEDDTMAVFLRERKSWIAMRRQKLKWWHRVCSVVFTIAFVGVLTASVLLAFAGAAVVAVTAATACSTVIKAVLEPLVHAALDEQEMKLKEEDEVVEAMRDGELLVQKFKGLVSHAERVAAELDDMMKHVEFAREWGYGEEAVEVVMAGMMQKMNEVERSVEELKGKMEECCYSIRQFDSKFIKIITN
ncbi:UPF0496 protein At5g66675-like [Zingiber officinale]|uniref:UPF0496 protein At5g66675-like n=1 Tax=Zingiber officinale TaxID=94328 RepID=UPI001C4B10B6|nr:UPF0496 protein At5g66675-like [Zingiber officinale]